MMRRRWLAGAATLLVGAGVFTLTPDNSAGGAVAATVYTRTLAGTDFLPLAHQLSNEFVSGTGGGVYPVASSSVPAGFAFLEANVTLPVGANITSVSFFYQDCGLTAPARPYADYYFGSYRPSTGSYAEALPLAHGGFGTCNHNYTFTQSRPTIATVTAERRYVLGVDTLFFPGNTVSDPSWLISGARVRFTCATTCAP